MMFYLKENLQCPNVAFACEIIKHQFVKVGEKWKLAYFPNKLL